MLTAGVLSGSLLFAACGGGDGDSDATTTTTTSIPVTQPSVTAAPPVDTTPIATDPPGVVYVTEGASVLVTNASRVNGAAGRLSERLAAVGYTVVTPGNYTLGNLDVTKIYYDPLNTSALAVADSLKAAFGGGAIEIVEVGTPPPVDTGSLGGAGVLIAMGNDIADKTLDELQGIVTESSGDATGSSTGSGTGSGTDTGSGTAGG